MKGSEVNVCIIKIIKNMDQKEDYSNENNELKVLILKLNQDKTMYEKKVQRRNQEITRLKQLLQDKDEQLGRMGSAPP